MEAVGHAQARAAGQALANLAPAAVVSSDLRRAAETAACVGLPVTVDPRLREVDVGEWSGLTRAEIAERFPVTFDAWLRGEDVRREGGETMAEVTARAVAAVRSHLEAAAGGPLVVVTHGGTSRSLVLALLGLPESCRGAFAVLGNARWAALVRHGDGWRLTAYNVGREPEAAGEPPDDTGAEPVL
jgi:probable phosphoglycerate mutase